MARKYLWRHGEERREREVQRSRGFDLRGVAGSGYKRRARHFEETGELWRGGVYLSLAAKLQTLRIVDGKLQFGKQITQNAYGMKQTKENDHESV